MKKEETESQNQTKQKFSIFQITSFVLVIILIVAVIVQIGVIINLKNKADNLKDKLDKLPPQQSVVQIENLQEIESFRND